MRPTPRASVTNLSSSVGELPAPVCAITGATGYVGSRMVMRLERSGWHIRLLSRANTNQRDPTISHVHFELGQDVRPEALEGVKALVHCAYDFSAKGEHEITRVNIDGSRRLFKAAREAGVERIVLISTIAAFPEARSSYGRAKLSIERAALEYCAAIVRCGLVWGSQGGAMFGALEQVVGRSYILPQPVPSRRRLNVVHEDDLVTFVEAILDLWPAGSGKLLVAASPETLTFTELMHSLGPRIGRWPLFVHVPWRSAWLGLRALEVLGIRMRFGSDSLLSIVRADDHPLARATQDAASYGVRFRPYGYA